MSTNRTSCWPNKKSIKNVIFHSVRLLGLVVTYSQCQTSITAESVLNWFFGIDYPFPTISNTVSNAMFLTLFGVNLIIIIESNYKKDVQLHITEKFTLVDQQLTIKLQLPIAYEKEKHQVFIGNVIVLFMLKCVYQLSKNGIQIVIECKTMSNNVVKGFW